MTEAKQTKVQRKCGHSETFTFYGSLRERNRRIRWLCARDCAKCSRPANATRPA